MNLFSNLQSLNFGVSKFSMPKDSVVGVTTMSRPDYNCGWELELCTVRHERFSETFGYHLMYKLVGKERILMIKVPSVINDDELVKVVNEVLTKG